MKESNIVGDILRYIEWDCNCLVRIASGEDDSRFMSPDFYRGRIDGYISVLKNSIMLNKK